MPPGWNRSAPRPRSVASGGGAAVEHLELEVVVADVDGDAREAARQAEAGRVELVAGRDDGDAIARGEPGEGARQGGGHVGEAAGLGVGVDLRRDVQNLHS